MPSPVSLTVRRTCDECKGEEGKSGTGEEADEEAGRLPALPGKHSRRRLTRPPRGVNLIAFMSRFQITCCNLLGSPLTRQLASSSSVSIGIPFASAAGRSASIAACTIGATLSGRTSSWRLPVMMRETSRRSSMSRACERALRSIISSARSRFSVRSTSPLRISVAQPRIEVSGVRSSCESVARNSSFSRSASSARWRRSRSRASRAARSSSASVRAVTSRTSESTETSLPFSSCKTELYHSQ